MNAARRRIARIAVTAAMVAAVGVFALTIEWHQTWEALRSVDASILLAAAVVNLASLMLKGVRWWVFLRAAGAPSLSLALRATFAGAGLNNILVANGGEAARVMFVSSSTGIAASRVLASLALERLFETIGYIILLVASVTLLRLPPPLDRARPIAWIALAAVAALCAYLMRGRAAPSAIVPSVIVPSAIVPSEGGWLERMRAAARSMLQSVRTMSTAPNFGLALVITLAAWALQIATYALTARSTTPHFPLTGTIAALLAVNVSFAFRATPGNVGVFQVVYAVMASAFGVDKDHALAIAILIQFQQVVPVTAIGIALSPRFLWPRAASG